MNTQVEEQNCDVEEEHSFMNSYTAVTLNRNIPSRTATKL